MNRLATHFSWRIYAKIRNENAPNKDFKDIEIVKNFHSKNKKLVLRPRIITKRTKNKKE